MLGHSHTVVATRAIIDLYNDCKPLVATHAHTCSNTMLCCALSLCLQLSKESFPPCMCHLHESLRRDHHLKHFARLQYGLFLKGIGLTLEQALAFWRAEFTKKMDVDKVEMDTAVVFP